MPAQTTLTSDQAQIRELMDRWAEGIRSRDPHTVALGVARDAILFDVIDPLQCTGVSAVRKRAEQWLSQFQGEVGFEIRDLNIVCGDEVAFSHSLNHVMGSTTDNRKIDMWWRSTVCYRKMDGRWVVVHEHNSVPFNMENGKASLELKP